MPFTTELEGIRNYGELLLGPYTGEKGRRQKGKKAEKDRQKERNKLRKKGGWVARCQLLKQWNGMPSGGRKTQFLQSSGACRADCEKLTITEEEKQVPRPCCLRANTDRLRLCVRLDLHGSDS